VFRQVKKRSCQCSRSLEFITELNDNPLKTFKNHASSLLKGGPGKNQPQSSGLDQRQLSVSEHDEDSFCDFCHTKYNVIKQNYAPCQKIEILDFGAPENHKNMVSLRSNISSCWLIDPFINTANVGDMICLTAFYFLTPQQKFVNQRCISPLLGNFVAFDIVQVNPFNQTLDSDANLRKIFYNQSASTSTTSTKRLSQAPHLNARMLGLTVANI